jgi:hypothetical protein
MQQKIVCQSGHHNSRKNKTNVGCHAQQNSLDDENNPFVFYLSLSAKFVIKPGHAGE